MERGAEVALMARRSQLLAARPELLYAARPERAERALRPDDGRHPLDVILLAGSSDLDTICAAAVARLARRYSADLVAVVGALPPDYLLAVHYALPMENRRPCGRDEVWAYHVAHGPQDVDEYLVGLDAFVQEPLPEPEGLTAADAEGFRTFSNNMLRRAVGMPHDMTDQDEHIAAAGERLAARLGFA
jgi:hypothetical protein